ncbi:MAG: hypothetical protein ACTSRZ_16790 [Promethearchaeota archaeon]
MKFYEIWIMNNDGLPFFYTHMEGIEREINEGMITSFISAVSIMLNSNSNEQLNTIKLKNSKILIFPGPNDAKFFTIVRTSIKEKDKNIRREVEKITNLFYSKYGQYIKNWSGNVTIFLDFEEYIKDYI